MCLYKNKNTCARVTELDERQENNLIFPLSSKMSRITESIFQ